MKNLSICFFYLACLGWCAGLIVHIISILGIYPGRYWWILHIGIIVVWIPFVRKLKNQTGYASREPAMARNLREFTQKYLHNAPKWLLFLAFAGFFYAFINFILFAISNPNQVATEGGKYVLSCKGTFIRYLSEQEFFSEKAKVVRGFSGHWLAFYGLAAAGLYPTTSSENKNE